MLRSTPIPREFYLDSPDVVAPALLGKLLIRRLGGRPGGKLLAGRIVEVEAYIGTDDPAAHAFAGKTARNAVLFGPPGHAYVYFIYGMHYCLNVSCEPEGEAGSVLIRALEPVAGLEEMARLRKLGAVNSPGPKAAVDRRLLTTGPGRLCQALGISRTEHDGVDLTDSDSDLYIAADAAESPRVVVTPRIGISKAADRPLRFCVAGSRFVTKAPKLGQ